jgi:hypothetical protein
VVGRSHPINHNFMQRRFCGTGKQELDSPTLAEEVCLSIGIEIRDGHKTPSPVDESKPAEVRLRASNLAVAHNRASESIRELASPAAVRCRRKFLHFFPEGFRDETYLAWERDYKVNAHREWNRVLNQRLHADLMRKGKFAEVALRAVRIEARTNFIFSFEKMALRDAVKSAAGAKAFSTGLYDFLYGRGSRQEKFERWCEVVAALPRKQTRVSTWPIVTVFGFIAQPDQHIFLKPNVTRRAAQEYRFPFHYESRPGHNVYANCLEFAEEVRRDLRDLRPRDMIDLQSFIWVQGSTEYEE